MTFIKSKKRVSGSMCNNIRSHLKNRILVQDQGGAEFQPADILKYDEDLKREPNADIGPKGIFEIASNNPYRREINL